MGGIYRQTKLIRHIVLIIVLFSVFLTSFYGNVILHEFGHFTAAKYFNLDPKLDLENSKELFYTFSNKPLAKTSFNIPLNSFQDAVITMMGPIVNLLLFLATFSFFILKKNLNKYTQLTLILIMFTSLFSFTYNLMFNIPYTDGYYLLKIFA